MKRALLLVLACGGDATPSLIASGQLVTMKEGEQRTLQLTGPATLDATAPLHAAIDDGTLTLHPDCSTIAGTTGPPRLFVLTLHATGGDVPLAVEVTPSAEGECRPTLIACEPPMGTTCLDDITPSDCAGGQRLPDGGRIPVNYVEPNGSDSFPTPTLPDRVVAFEFVNPDPGDVKLNAIINTDGPFKFHFLSGTVACAPIVNQNIVGSFELDYRTGDGADPSTPVVSSGVFELGVNKETKPEPYGIQVVSCASTDQPGPGSCKQLPLANTVQWRIQKPGPNLDTTMQLRMWATPPPGGADTYSIKVEAVWDSLPQHIELDDGTKIATDAIFETASSAINTEPVVITAHLGTVDEACLKIKATGSGAGSGAGSSFSATFSRSVYVGSGAINCTP